MTPTPLQRLALRSVAAVALLAQAAVHWQLWRDGYKSISVIGPLFLAGVIAAVAFSVLVVVRPTFLGVAGALALSVGQVAALAMSKVTGLFGFMPQPGLTPIEATAVAAEIVGAVALAMLLAISLPRSPIALVQDATARRGR